MTRERESALGELWKGLTGGERPPELGPVDEEGSYWEGQEGYHPGARVGALRVAWEETSSGRRVAAKIDQSLGRLFLYTDGRTREELAVDLEGRELDGEALGSVEELAAAIARRAARVARETA